MAVAHFYIVYFVYFIAFASANRAAIPSPIILLIIAYAALLFWLERGALKEAQGALAAYLVLMSLMLWAASETWVQHREPWAIGAFAGALLLTVSSTILLLDKTRTPIPWSRILIAATFAAGQWLIAWSVWGYGLAAHSAAAEWIVHDMKRSGLRRSFTLCVPFAMAQRMPTVQSTDDSHWRIRRRR